MAQTHLPGDALWFRNTRMGRRRELTSGPGGRSGEDGAVGAAHVVVANFHAEVPLLHAARRHLQHAAVHRRHSHPLSAACTCLSERALGINSPPSRLYQPENGGVGGWGVRAWGNSCENTSKVDFSERKSANK